ncbi:MAG: hypothetical protein M4D80_41230 [Myxococcota bacterium]|nr:hypothetical protein [Deltaproteobacteria bacterium]MDQ3341618.1 hypothetical protein [Myxococcota bacterium]
MKIWALGALVAVTCAVGCKAKDKPPATGSAATPVASGSARAATPDAGAVAAALERSPLQQVLREIRDDGTWSKETALHAFAGAFGDLPGVKAATGPRPEIELTCIAARMLQKYWSAITPEQRAAANALLGRKLGPDLASVYAPTDTVYASAGLGSYSDDREQSQTNTVRDTALAIEIAEYEGMIKGVIDRLSGLTGRNLPLRISVELGDVQPPSTVAALFADYEDVGKENNGRGMGAANECIMMIYPIGRKLGIHSKELAAALAHETWHCFQATILGGARYKSAAPWIIEGQAMWVGEAYAAGSQLEVTVRHWKEYLLEAVDSKPVFARSYDAIGFYAHLEDEGVSVWPRLGKMMEAGDNIRAFDIGIAGTKALTSFGASFFLDPRPTKQFTMTSSPGRPPGVVVPRKKFTLGNGDTAEVLARQRATNDFAEVDVSTDVLTVGAFGHGILGDMAGPVHELSAGTRSFCVKAPCKCPDGSTPIEKLTPLSAKSRIAVSGDALAGSRATITAYSMEEFCKGPKPPDRRKWQGVWHSTKYRTISGTFELDATMTSTKITGVVSIDNSKCVSGGAVEGVINAGTVKFGVVEASARVDWTGKISGDKMAGEFAAKGCGEDVGTWSAAR